MRSIHLFLLLASLMVISVRPAHASEVFQFDESGDISYSVSGGPFIPMPAGILESDFTHGVSGDVLVYDLTSELVGFDMSNGDDPIGGDGGLVGDLRFTDSSGALNGNEYCSETQQCLMIFYVFDDDGLPADVGDISTDFLTTQKPSTTLENGKFTLEDDPITYEGTIAPEPPPYSLIVMGLGGFALLGCRCRAAAR